MVIPLRIFGFDHGVGHPLLHLCDAKVPNCRKNKAFKDLDHYAEWPKVADAVIKAESLTLQRHLQNMLFYHKGLLVRKKPLPFVACDRKATILHVQIGSAH